MKLNDWKATRFATYSQRRNTTRKDRSDQKPSRMTSSLDELRALPPLSKPPAAADFLSFALLASPYAALTFERRAKASADISFFPASAADEDDEVLVDEEDD